MDEQEAFEKLLMMHQDAKRFRMAYLAQLAKFAEEFKQPIEQVDEAVREKKYGF